MATLPSISSNFNVSPGARSGQGPYGAVPGSVGLPASTYSQTGGVLTSLPQLTSQAGAVTGAELNGQISPGTSNFLQQKAAQFGVSMGMPGFSNDSFNSHNLVRSLGLNSEALSQQGVQDYRGILGSIAQTQLSPELQNEVATQNSVWNSAPDPGAAARQQIQTLKDLYSWEQNPSGGTETSEHISPLPGSYNIGGYAPAGIKLS